MSECGRCGLAVPPSATVCFNCGRRVGKLRPAAPKADKRTARVGTVGTKTRPKTRAPKSSPTKPRRNPAPPHMPDEWFVTDGTDESPSFLRRLAIRWETLKGEVLTRQVTREKAILWTAVAGSAVVVGLIAAIVFGP